MPKALHVSDLSEEVRERLDLRIVDLDLSARATNVCNFAGISTVGELAQATSDDLGRIPNCGRKTIAEIEQTLETFGLSLGMRIAGWQAPRTRPKPLEGAPPPPPPPRPRRAVVSKRAECLEEELHALLSLVVEGRNLDIVSKYWGLGGQGPRTLESVGREYGMSRERVRQIVQRIEDRLRKYNVDTPWLTQAMDCIGALTPATPERLKVELRARGIARSDFDIGALKWVCVVVGRRYPFVDCAIGDATVIVRAKDEDLMVEFFRACRRRTSSDGCVNFEAVCDELGVSEGERDKLRTCVEAGDCIWLDDDRRWLMAKNRPRNRVLNLARKVFAVTPSLPLSELRRAIAKSRRLAVAPPAAVVGALLNESGLAKVEGDIATVNPSEDLSEAIAQGSVESTLVAVLRDNLPALGWERFQELSIARGVNPISFGIYSSQSPAVSRVARGVYALVGAPVPPGAVEEISAAAAAARIPAEFGWSPRGTLWCAIAMTTAVLSGGTAMIPSSVSEMADGDWPIRIGDRDTQEMLKVGSGFMRGFKRAALNAGAEVGDFCIVEFDIVARRAALFIGDDELVDAWEAGEERGTEEDDSDEDDRE